MSPLPPVGAAGEAHTLLMREKAASEAAAAAAAAAAGVRDPGGLEGESRSLDAALEVLEGVEQHAFMTPRERARFVKDLQGLARGYRDTNGKLLDEVAALRARVESLEGRENALAGELREQGKVTAMYEGFAYVPVSLSADALQADVEGIENQIRTHELVTDTPQNLLPPQLPPDANGRKWALMELKFSRLEQLIVVLKKKLLRYEENEHLARVVEEYGDLPHLIRDNNRLKHENTKLRSREQRFAADSLLNRYFGETDGSFLRVLVMALQNELASHRALVAKHNLAANPNLALLIKPPGELPDPTTLADLDTWLQDPLLVNDFSEELKAWRDANIGASPPSQVSSANALSLLQELNRVKETNALLVQQVQRLENERKLGATVAVMRQYCDQEFAHPLKGLAKKQVLDLNEKLLAELKSVNSKFARAETTLAMQTDVLATLSGEKQTLMEENVMIGKRVLQLLQQNKALRLRMEKSAELSHSLYLANLSTIQGVLASKLPPDQVEEFVQFFHRDLLLSYLTLHRSATRLQAWYRGVKVRRSMRLRFAFVARASLRFKRRHPGSTSASLPGSASGPAYDGGDGGEGSDGGSEIVVVSGGDEDLGPNGSTSLVDGPVPEFLPVLHTLSRIILHVDADIQTVLQIKSVLAIVQREIQETLRPSMEMELARWERYVNHKHARMNQVVARVLKPKETADFAQQFLSKGVEVGTQTEEEAEGDGGRRDRRSKAKSKDGKGGSDHKRRGKRR